MPTSNENKLMVELRVAKIPGIGHIAVHYWFVIHQHGQTQRWEVWQLPSQNQTSWHHIHKNLLAFDTGVGNGDSWVETRWFGEQATRLTTVLKDSPQTYPFKQRYHYWPGPNSNTYVQWILTEAGIEHQMIPQGIGKNHLGWVGWRTSQTTKAFSTPLFGFRYRCSNYFEIHFLHLAISVCINPFVLRTFFYLASPRVKP